MHCRSLTVGLTACLWLIVGTLAFAPAAQASGARDGGTCAGARQGCIGTLVNLVNGERAKYGLAPLVLRKAQSRGEGSCVGSYGHSVAMATSGDIWHINASYPRASFPTDVCGSHRLVGENVGFSGSGDELSDLSTIHRMMMAEPHDSATCRSTANHACNILNPAFHHIGIGIYVANGSTWLTEDFTN